MSKIKITCEAKEYLDFSEMAEFQGELKQRTDADFEKIENSIKKHGFAFPFFIWKNGDTNFVLDGHGRYGALQRMQSKGYEDKLCIWNHDKRFCAEVYCRRFFNPKR